jgi:hypothetical protein
MLDLSLNEVETLAHKAARGAGLPWGVAEDTGRAAAWISRRFGDWAEPLLALLETAPPPEESPLLLAGWLADAAAPRRIARVARPLWALPGLLTTTTRPVSIFFENAEVRCNPCEGASATVPAEALAALPVGSLTVASASAPLPPLPCALNKRFRRSLVALADWQRLDALAQRTYVPASDRSRRSGAGAGVLDDE